MAKAVRIRVKDWSKYPGGRFRRDGRFSGEEFRDDVLLPVLREALGTGDTVFVNLDGTAGYASSFLEEVFGGLVRNHRFSRAKLLPALKVEATDTLYAPYLQLALRYLAEADAATQETSQAS